MAEPNKPTKEELDAKIQEAIEAAPEETPEEEVVEEAPVVEEKEEEVVETPEEEVVEEAPKEDYLKKELSASARENQKILAKNRVMNKALLDAEEIPEPTDEEMKGKFNDWDTMSDIEQTLAKETVVSRKWRETIAQAKGQATKIEKWHDSVDEFVSDPKSLLKYTDLEGKQDDFREYATQEANNSVPFEVLVPAFLHTHTTGKKSNKGSMFPRATGGVKEKPQPKSDKVSLEEARKIRETDYNEYKRLLQEGKIDRNI